MYARTVIQQLLPGLLFVLIAADLSLNRNAHVAEQIPKAQPSVLIVE